MPNWMDAFKKKEKEKEDDDDLEIKAVTEKIGKIDTIEKDFGEFRAEHKKSSDRLNAFLEEQETEKRKRKADELAARVAKENKETNDELEELVVTDPRKAMELIADAKNSRLTAAVINTQSQLLRRQIFEENAAEFEYYTPENADFKKMVDGFIENLPLDQKTNTEILKNCYYVAMGKQNQAIRENKLKSRFASVSTNSVGNNSSKDKDTIVLSELQKKAAAALGLTEEDYGKTARELKYV